MNSLNHRARECAFNTNVRRGKTNEDSDEMGGGGGGGGDEERA